MTAGVVDYQSLVITGAFMEEIDVYLQRCLIGSVCLQRHLFGWPQMALLRCRSVIWQKVRYTLPGKLSGIVQLKDPQLFINNISKPKLPYSSFYSKPSTCFKFLFTLV